MFQLLYTLDQLTQAPPVDVLIIGSGPAGTSVAEYLYTMNDSLRIGVLERGPILATTHIGNFTEVEDPTRPLIPGGAGYRRGRFISAHEKFIWKGAFQQGMMIHALGGRGIVAGAHLTRYHDDDFHCWPGGTWPITSKDLEPYYTRAELIRHVCCGEHQGALQVWAMGQLRRFNAYPPPWGIDIGTGRGFELGRGYDSAVSRLWALINDDYIEAKCKARPRRLLVCPNVYVTQIRTGRNKAASLSCFDTVGTAGRVALPVHKALVLAASPIESARLALNSGLGATNPNVGKYLADHIYVQAGILLKNPVLTNNQGQGINVVIPPTDSKLDHRFHIEIRGEPTEKDPNVLYIQLTVVGATEPQEKNCVVLANEKDEYGAPFAHARFDYSNGDKARIEIMRIRLHQAAEGLGWTGPLEGVTYDYGPSVPQGGTVRVLPPGRSHHESGTLRMGDSPRHSVTNSDGRFHDLDNLYVADASLFPCVGVANPMLTISALGYRLANHLIRTLRPELSESKENGVPHEARK
jgi:choline dehydrogenase-like flavoprotein